VRESAIRATGVARRGISKSVCEFADFCIGKRASADGRPKIDERHALMVEDADGTNGMKSGP
jgi:hypothetical protein